MSEEELPEREYIINWFGIGSDLAHMLKEGLSPIQCMKQLRNQRVHERIFRCKDCCLRDEIEYCERLGFYVGDYGYCAWYKINDRY